MLKVALEVSTIGLGQLDSGSGYNRTGVFRVTDEITKEMLRYPDVDLYLLFWEFPATSILASEYLQSLGYKPKIMNRNPIAEDLLYKLLSDHPRLPKRLAVMNILSKITRMFKRKKHFNEMDIVHSLYYKTPSHIDPQKKIRFRTIHDIFPLTHQEFFPKKHQTRFKKSFDDIDINNDWFFAVSESTKNDFCDFFKLSADRIVVNHLAASRDQYYHETDQERIESVKKHLNFPEGDYFLNIATLEPRKNLLFLIGCFKKLIETIGQNNHYYLVLIGKNGWMLDSLHKNIQSDPILRERVILPGFIPDEMLSVVYSGALAFVYPSLYEGFGLPVLEAMQCGTPVITSNRSSLPEVAGKACMLIDPENEDELCQAMLDLIGDRQLREDLKRKGLERAKLFSWKLCAKRTVQAYHYALESKS